MLRQRFRLMLSRRALPRQQTLHAVIRWSFDNLGRRAQVLLAVSVCAGSCDLDAVRALTGPDADPPDSSRALSRLTEMSLVTVRHELGCAIPAARNGAPVRCRRAAGGGALPASNDRHRDHYTQLAEAACDQLRDDRRDAAAAAPGPRARQPARALDWAVTGSGPSARGWSGAQLRFWIARGLVAAGFEQASAVLAVADSPGPAQTLARLELDAAELALRRPPRRCPQTRAGSDAPRTASADGAPRSSAP